MTVKLFLYALLGAAFTLHGATVANHSPAVLLRPGEVQSLNIFDGVSLTRKAVIQESSAAQLIGDRPAVTDQRIYHFFDNASYTVTVTRVSETFTGARLAEGSCTGSPEISFLCVTSSEKIRLELSDRRRGVLYQVTSTPGGELNVYEFDRSKAGAVFWNDTIPLYKKTVNSSVLSLSASAEAPADPVPLSTTEIDVMLVFDQTAQSWANANGGITNFANAAIVKMNATHTASGTECSYRLLHIYLSDHTYDSENSTLGTVLNNIANEAGDLSEISGVRDVVGADLACMLVDTGISYGQTGIGHIPGDSTGYDQAAFSVCAIRAVNADDTLTHEIAHNMGCDHPKNLVGSPGPGVFSYAAGWYFTGANSVKYFTIMGYNNDGVGNTYLPCGLFSSPLLPPFQGTVPGDAADGDNVRCLQQMKGVIAAYRVSAVNTVQNPVIAPPTGTTFSGWLDITMSCTTSGADIRYTVDGSEPDISSTLYTNAIMITATTTFKARAFKAGMDTSAVVTAYYTLAGENDDFVDALVISGSSGSTTGSNLGATKESGEPDHDSRGGASAWWKWTATGNGSVTFDTNGSSFDTIMAAYTGSAVNSLTQLAADDDGGSGTSSLITFAVTAGTVYYIAVDGYSGAEGGIMLHWAMQVFNISSCEIVRDAGTTSLHITFDADSGETYVVKQKDSLSGPEPWSDLNPPIILSPPYDATYELIFDITGAAGSSFYKIIRQ